MAAFDSNAFDTNAFSTDAFDFDSEPPPITPSDDHWGGSLMVRRVLVSGKIANPPEDFVESGHKDPT